MESRRLADRWRSRKLGRNFTDNSQSHSRVIENAVREAYSAAAERPQARHPFPVGRRFAESVGYPAAMLDGVSCAAVEAFAGVSNVSIAAPIRTGSTVLDLGCGAGLDAIIAARRTGASGLVVGVDFSREMLARAAEARSQGRTHNLHLLHAQAGNLPLQDASVDAAVVNGIFNLNPSRDALFRELARVVRRGGFVFAAELVLLEPLSAAARTNAKNWFA